MSINLNDPAALTLDAVRQLLASRNDSVARQLRITLDGFAVIADYDSAEDRAEFLCRSETWEVGNSYVGLKASQDDAWVERVFNALKANWPNRTGLVFDF